MAKNRIFFTISGDFSSVMLKSKDIILTAEVTQLQQERLQYLLEEYNSTKNTTNYNPDILDSLTYMIKRIGAKRL